MKMDTISKTQLERLESRLYIPQDPGCIPDWLRTQRKLYFWSPPYLAMSPAFFLEYSRIPFTDCTGNRSRIWKCTWVGRRTMISAHEFMPLHTDASMHHSLKVSRQYRLFTGAGFPWVMPPHELDKLPVEVWLGPCGHEPTTALGFISPYGIFRELVSAGDNAWHMRTALGGGQQTLSPAMNEEQIRTMVRHNGWLTIISGHRNPEPGETAAHFATH